MDLVITVAIVILLIAIILGSLRRGIQSLISFVLLGILAMVVVVRVSAESLASSSNLIGGNQENAPPATAIKAFENFARTTNTYLDEWIAGQTGGSPLIPNGSGNGNGGIDTGSGTTTTPSGGIGGNSDSGGTNDGGANGGGTSGISGDRSGNTSGTNSNSGSQNPVRAWW